MMNTFASQYFQAISRALESAQASLADRAPIELESAFARLCSLALRLRETGGVLYFVGNGGSAMMSGHMAEDFCKNAGVRSMAFNDAAFLTAVGNDTSFEQVFETPLMALGRPGDALATISSSGNSPNVLAAIRAARKLGMQIVTFSSMSPDNQSRGSGDINLWVPGKTYGVAESAHAVLLHCWLDRFMNVADWEK